MIFVREHTRNRTKMHLQQRYRHRGLNDLLSYLVQLDDCTILHKDGALSRHFCYIAPDQASSTDQDLDFHAQTWANAVNFLGNGWMIETNVASQRFDYRMKTRDFPDVVSALIDDERRLQYQEGQYFKTTYYLSVTWKPEQLVQSKLRRFAIDRDTESDIGFDAQLKQFDRTLNEFIGYLKRSLITLTPLQEHELTTYLHYCIGGHNHRLAKPTAGTFLDCYVADEFVGGFEPKIAGKTIKVLGIDDLPAYSYPCILEELNCLPIEYRWSSRFVCLDRTTAKAYLKRYERHWSSKAIGVMGVIRESLGLPARRDEDAQATADALKQAQVEQSAGQMSYGFYNSTLVLIHEDHDFLQRMSEEIVKRIQQLDFRVRDESVNAAESYLGSLPGHGDYNLRKMFQPSYFMGHAFPISALYQGVPEAPCPKRGYRGQPPLLLTATQGNRPFALNLHVGDVGHTAILGPTGMGKSTLNAIVMASHRKYPESRIVVLDKDHSNRIPILALGGRYIDPETDDFQLAPLGRLRPDQPSALEQTMDWLEACCRVQGVDITPARRSALREALLRLEKEAPAYKNLNHLSIQEPVLREAMTAFNQGQRQSVLNGTTPAFSQSDVLGIEMSTWVKAHSDDRDVALPVIKALFNELEVLFKERRPTLLILEEAWLYLRHALFRDKLADWFKTLRKFNVSVIFISQDLDDIVRSDAASVIQTSCMTRIYLPNKKANEKKVTELYSAFGLNDQQIQMIYNAIPKRDYYYQSQLGNRLFRLDLEALAQAFLCVSEKQDVDTFNTLYQFDHADWVLDWLRYKGLGEWYAFAKQHYF